MDISGDRVKLNVPRVPAEHMPPTVVPVTRAEREVWSPPERDRMMAQ
jgi:hypothetical protein